MHSKSTDAAPSKVKPTAKLIIEEVHVSSNSTQDKYFWGYLKSNK